MKHERHSPFSSILTALELFIDQSLWQSEKLLAVHFVFLICTGVLILIVVLATKQQSDNLGPRIIIA